MAGTILEAVDTEKLRGKRAFLRVDFNVPQDQDGNITDDSRIVASLPTIRYLRECGVKIIIATHLGRPKGKVNDKYRVNPIAKRLSELLDLPVVKLDEAIGSKVQEAVAKLEDGDICLLENVRFYPGEESNDPEFAAELAKLADFYVNDAFGAAHRAHASTVGIASYLSISMPGLLLAKEIAMLGTKLQEPERPFTAIIGGSKISSKIAVLEELIKNVDVLLVGGGMAYTFIKAQGGQIGQSICEDDQLEIAARILEIADKRGTAIILPKDTRCVPSRSASGEAVDIFKQYSTDAQLDVEIFPSNQIEDGWQGMDIGPETEEEFAKLVSQSRTILWNGPLGVFEYDSLAQGTRVVALALLELTSLGGTTIIGGGDSVAALEKFRLPKTAFTHVSTGGGASLEFLEGKVLPGVACLTYRASACA